MKTKKILISLLALLMLLSLCACGSKSADYAKSEYAASSTAEAPAPMEYYDADPSYGGFAMMGEAEAETPEGRSTESTRFPEALIFSISLYMGPVTGLSSPTPNIASMMQS